MGHVPHLAHRAGRPQLSFVCCRHDGTNAGYRRPDATARQAGAHDSGADDDPFSGVFRGNGIQ